MTELKRYYLLNGSPYIALFHDQDGVDNYVPPPGATPIPTPPDDSYVWSSDGWGPAPPVVPSTTDVAAERDRRRYLPYTVTVPSGTFVVDMDQISQANIQGLATVGMYLQSQGSAQITEFRDHDNVIHNLTPADLVALGMVVAVRIQALYQASWALKALNPVPSDYADDSHWPA